MLVNNENVFGFVVTFITSSLLFVSLIDSQAIYLVNILVLRTEENGQKLTEKSE